MLHNKETKRIITDISVEIIGSLLIGFAMYNFALNAEFPISCKLLPAVNVVTADPTKAKGPITFKLSGKIKSVQFTALKEVSPISFNPSGNTSSVILEQ